MLGVLWGGPQGPSNACQQVFFGTLVTCCCCSVLLCYICAHVFAYSSVRLQECVLLCLFLRARVLRSWARPWPPSVVCFRFRRCVCFCTGRCLLLLCGHLAHLYAGAPAFRPSMLLLCVARGLVNNVDPALVAGAKQKHTYSQNMQRTETCKTNNVGDNKQNLQKNMRQNN